MEASDAAGAPAIASPFNPVAPTISADSITTFTSEATRANALWWSVLLALCLVLLAPLTLADLPPILDYPNHLARLFVLAFGPNDPILSRFFEPRWGIIPNLALDLTVPPLLHLFPVHVVGRAVVGVIVLLPVLGSVAYHRALSGRLSYWPLASVLFAYNTALLRGFLNFVASVGLALLIAAAWIAWRESRPRLAIPIAVAGAVALFFWHLTGLLFFAILIGGHELASLRPILFQPVRILWRIAAGIAVFAAPVVLYAVSDLGGMQGDAEFRPLMEKANAALYPVINYFLPLDLFTAAVCVAVPILCLAARWCVIPFRAAAAIVVLLALFIGLPVGFKGTYDLDTRFIIMAAFTIAAALTPIALPRRIERAIGTLVLVLFIARISVLLTVWEPWAAELSAFRSIIAPIQPGDVVMTVRSPRRDEPNIWTTIVSARRLSDGSVNDTHLPGLLVIEHRAFWPFLFDNLSQQPINKREPYRTAATLVDNSSDPIALLASGAPELWPFTHVLVLGPNPADLATTGLKLIRQNNDAAMFAVMRDEINQGPPRPRPPDR